MATAKRNLRLAVLCGGPTSEYDVSLRSGRQIATALRKHHTVTRLVLPREPRRLMRFLENKLRGRDLAVLAALHGEWGEDGRIQAMLEALGIRYTGSGVLASALGMHKLLSFQLAARAGMRVPAYFSLSHPASSEVVHARIAQTVRYPCVVKPNGAGSSIGVSIVRGPRKLGAALRRAFAVDDAVIIQRFIRGREVTCGVLGNTGRTELLALPPVLIRTPPGTFFDYRAKYHSPTTKELCPAPLAPRTLAAIQAEAVKAHAVFRADGLTRTDLILAPDGALYFLEINTSPGMTEASLCPKEARSLGWDMGEFLDKIIGLAFAKRRA